MTPSPISSRPSRLHLLRLHFRHRLISILTLPLHPRFHILRPPSSFPSITVIMFTALARLTVLMAPLLPPFPLPGHACPPVISVEPIAGGVAVAI